MRYFASVEYTFLKNHVSPADVVMPKRGSVKSAGYDFVTPVTVTIPAGATRIIWTDVRAKMIGDEVLKLYPRSSVGIKHHIILANSTGIIDADYYDNPDTGGNIGICLYNYGKDTVDFEAGTRIAQGIFMKYLKTDNDSTVAQRIGGFGSTGE